MSQKSTPTTNESAPLTDESTALTDDQLYFGFAASPPDASAVTVYDTLRTDLLGDPFAFNVIGSSHYVAAERGGFHELCSCRAIEMDQRHVLDLTDRKEETYHFSGEGHDCEATVAIRSLESFPRERSFDLWYRFDERAVTTIDRTPDGYETYHTYPEFDCAVYTRTRFEQE